MVVVRIADTDSAPSPSENTMFIQADQFPIKAVKLFQGLDSAEITRTFPLSFPRTRDGRQVIEIVHLPANIQSVDVSITSTSGNMAILDHFHASIVKPKNNAPSSQTLCELATEQRRLEDERCLRKQSFAFLTTYIDSLAQCKSRSQPEVAQIVTFFDEFVEIGVTRSAEIAELDSKLTDVSKKISEEEQRLSNLSSNLPGKVVAVLSCNGLEAAELTLTYVVKQVSWKPTYDLHISMTRNTPSPAVTLNFRCAVTQRTGESWENVSLALTTADLVSQLIQIPEPKMMNIGLGPTNTSQHMYVPTMPSGPRRIPAGVVPLGQYEPGDAPRFGQPSGSLFSLSNVRERADYGLSPSPPREHHRVSQGYDQMDEREPLARPPFEHGALLGPDGDRPQYRRTSEFETPPLSPVPAIGDAPSVNITSQQVSRLISHDSKDPITHVTTRNVFIPSDNAEHNVLVTSLALQAEFMRVVTLSIDAHVYYTCEVKNTSGCVLLPGTVKTYLDDKHVSSGEIHSTDLPQTLGCALAVDTGLKTIHTRAPDALPSVLALTGKATARCFTTRARSRHAVLSCGAPSRCPRIHVPRSS